MKSFSTLLCKGGLKKFIYFYNEVHGLARKFSDISNHVFFCCCFPKKLHRKTSNVRLLLFLFLKFVIANVLPFALPFLKMTTNKA